jgi:lipopolysaccharide export system protein LptA
MIRFALFAILATAVTVASPPRAMAQGQGFQLGQTLQITDEPLEIEAEELEVDQATGTTIFSGNVLATQGSLRLTAQELRLVTREGGDGRQEVIRLEASGGVTMVTPSEAADAREIVYSLETETLVARGDVVLAQGGNTLTGQELNVNIRTGAGRISGGVRTIIRFD